MHFVCKQESIQNEICVWVDTEYWIHESRYNTYMTHVYTHMQLLNRVGCPTNVKSFSVRTTGTPLVYYPYPLLCSKNKVLTNNNV